jgi:hypothetical protein
VGMPVEPLPPPRSFEEQQRILDELIAKARR